MIASGYTGRKGKGGFYRVNRADGERSREAIDLRTGEYRPEQPRRQLPELGAAGRDLRALLAGDHPACRYAWRVMGRALAYAASLVPESDRPDRCRRCRPCGSATTGAAARSNWPTASAWSGWSRTWLPTMRRSRRCCASPPVAASTAEGTGGCEALCLDGEYHPIVRPAGVLLLGGHQARCRTLAQSRRSAVGYRGRRGVPGIHL